MKTLLYANRAEPKSISEISILQRLGILLNYVACIGSVISLLRKIFGTGIYDLLFNIMSASSIYN